MAVTAAITLDHSAAQAGQLAHGQLIVTAAGTGGIITHVHIHAGAAAPCRISQPNRIPTTQSNIVLGGTGGPDDTYYAGVPNDGSVALAFTFVADAPQAHSANPSNLGPPSTINYVIGATLILDDESVISASTATLTVSPPDAFSH